MFPQVREGLAQVNRLGAGLLLRLLQHSPVGQPGGEENSAAAGGSDLLLCQGERQPRQRPAYQHHFRH